MLHRRLPKDFDALILLILAVGILVRCYGIDFGLPHTRCRPDENVVIRHALYSSIKALHPTTFSYGSFYKYILLFLYALYYLFGLVSGRFTSTLDLIREYAVDPTNLFLINRLLAALLGTATVFIVYLIAKRLFDRRVALISSLFLSLAYLHVRDSHFGNVDVPMTFFIMCSFLFIVKSYRKGILKNYILSGLLAGLATSTKYAGILLIAPMLIAHFCNIPDRKDKWSKLFLDRRILLFFLFVVIGFLVGTPYSVIDFSAFTGDIFFQAIEHQTMGHEIILGRGWWHFLSFSLFFGLGWPLLFASIGGILILAKRDIRSAALLCSFPALYYFLAGRGYTVFARYTIPMIPFLCVTGSICALFISDKLLGKSKRYFANVLIAAISISIMTPSINNIIKFDMLLTKRDNRLIVTEWIHKNIPEGSSIYQTGSIWGRLELYDTPGALKKRLKSQVDTGYKSRLLEAAVDHLRDEGILGYEGWKYDDRIRRFTFEGKRKDLPEYIVVEESPLTAYSKVDETVRMYLKRDYSLKRSFVAVDIDSSDNLFDQQDAFYIPFAGFKNIIRPGPNIYIFERKR
ncbi:MAG: glycosyltransferase family 39 protein [Candidatus Omnitrophota bacterium]